MSFHSMDWAFSVKHINPLEKFVLVVIAASYSEYASSDASKNHLKDMTNMEGRGVDSVLYSLLVKGLIIQSGPDKFKLNVQGVTL